MAMKKKIVRKIAKKRITRRRRNVTVTITCKKGGCKIHPSVVVVYPGQRIAFKKSAEETVHIHVSGIGSIFRIKKEKRHPYMIPWGTPVGIYPYAAFCYESGEFCTGSSMPIIIVPKDPSRGID